MSIELGRLNSGEKLEESEEVVALTLSNDFDELEEYLFRMKFAEPEVARSKEIWLFLLVMQLRSRWPYSVSGIPESQFVELQNAWEGDNFLLTFLKKMSQIGDFYFSKRARKQFIPILDNAIASERSRLDLN